MQNLNFNHFISSLAGLKKHLSLRRLARKRNKKRFRKILASLNIEERFTHIYKINYWNSNESGSGIGSTLEATKSLRFHLPLLFERFSIQSVFDGPCGDFNWMRFVVEKTNIKYCGGDIVSPIIKANQSKYSSDRIKFIQIDLTKQVPPKADLMICRDCLFHLSYKDTKNLLNNFIHSETPYLLTTSYENNNAFSNQDIITGHFRLIDLFSEPYNFPTDTSYRIDDFLPENLARHMYLWSRDQVIQAMQNTRLN